MAIIASMFSIVNFITAQANLVGQLANMAGDSFLVLSKDARSLSESQLDFDDITVLRNCSVLKNVFPQKILGCTLEAVSGNFSVSVRGVEDVGAYLHFLHASVNGSVAKEFGDADAGAFLVNSASLNLDDKATLTFGDALLSVNIVGAVKAQSCVDGELFVSVQTVNYLSGNDFFSFAEITFKDGIIREDAVNQINSVLPDVMLVDVAQTSLFVQQSSAETLNFLSVWSVTVYIVVAAASYVVSTRLIIESEFELSTLHALGAKVRYLFGVVFTYNLLSAFVGSVLGVCVGVGGVQAASTVLRWFSQSVNVHPFLEWSQFGQVLLLSLIFSALGCLYPAIKCVHKRVVG